MIQEINRCFMRLEDRAERVTTKQIAETFVQVGPLIDILESKNNQVVYGRRGTGKTHALRFFQASKLEAGDLAIYIDAQNIGSNGSIYNDSALPIGERATRLLIDVCSAMHHELLDIFTAPGTDWDWSVIMPALDKFSRGFTEVRVAGQIETQSSEEETVVKSSGLKASANVSGTATVTASTDSQSSSRDAAYRREIGQEESWIDFNFFGQSIRDLADLLGGKRLWVLLDEWSTIPSDIQPYLADMLRRSLFGVQNISVKIAAIEHRSSFKVDKAGGGYTGIELGADITAAINLDDYLVVDNDEARAREFFKNFVVNHAKVVAEEIGIELPEAEEIISNAFTQENVFLEFVKSSEGVPRDAMHILSSAAQKAYQSSINMVGVRAAAQSFFQTEKYAAIQSNPENRIMLDWIRDEVIGGRQTRAFLILVGDEDKIIDRLFDQRALHILNRNRSAAHRPGERFIVYKLDYGLYVDLANTDKFPQDLLVGQDRGMDFSFDVPSDDARSYRRAILDLDQFYRVHPEIIRVRS